MPRVNREVYLKQDTLDSRKKDLIRRPGEFAKDKIMPIHVKWHEMTKRGIVRHIGKRSVQLASIAGIIYASAPNGTVDFWGDRGEPVSIEAQRADARFNALDKFSMQSVEGKFAMQYITNEYGYIDGVQNENGILGNVANNGNPDLYYRFGQVCLAGSAYDTTPSSIRGGATGDVSAAAAINYNAGTNQATIYPANSEAKPLVFTVVPYGNALEPDTQTKDTLLAYDCQPEGLVIEEADNAVNPRVWTQAPEN
jgi:hypothetical protein